MLSAVISSELSYPAMPLAWQPVHQRFVHSGPLVLGAAPFKFPTPTADRDQTVSRRSEPSSRTTFISEQLNPWNRFQLQDVMSRHRGAKHCRKYGLKGSISCYPQRTFYPLIDDHFTMNHRVTITNFRFCSICKSKQLGKLMLLHVHTMF